MNTLIQLAENRWLPDTFIRFGIRRFLNKRLSREDLGNCEDNRSHQDDLLRSFRQSQIAVESDKANEQHYAIPADFFELALGANKKYSCCYFPTGRETLNEAESLALAETCKRAEIRDGMSILELGCGWGSLTLWMAEHFPHSNIVAVSNSQSQRDYIVKLAHERGIAQHLTVLVCDINDFQPPSRDFDRVVSVEMLEHVRNHGKLFRRISHWLRPAGKCFVHIFCHRQFAYPFRENGSEDWMSRYFFTGGMMPSESWLLRHQHPLQLERQWCWSGLHYQRTCEHWLENLDSNREAVLEIFQQHFGHSAEVWVQRWRMFFMACAELFGTNAGNEWYVAHYLFAKQPVALSN